MSLRTRIAALERRREQAPRACPGCGTPNPCGVALAVEEDGTAAPICLNCGCDRERPAGPVKAYGGAFIRELIREEWL